MISAEHNDLLTRVGPGTPGGKLLRQYWQPVALLREFADGAAAGRPIRAVRLLGEDFVLFRDEQGRYGLLDRDCPHRNADLAYGRLEHGGLRCPFHGWLFDVHGNCLETPAEPISSQLCKHVRQRAYPVIAKSGVLFAYIGPGEPPAFPALDCLVAPESHTFAFKGLWECNWLQALEVGMDPAHASWLHRFFEDEDTAASYGKQFRSATNDTEAPITKVLREHDRPDITVHEAAHGLRIVTLRPLGEAGTHVRVTNVLFPQAFVIPMSTEITITQFHVPVDDNNNYWYSFFTSFGNPIDKEAMWQQRIPTYPPPAFRSRRNRANEWGYDPAEQATQTYTGMGFDINVHDQWACESQGPIQDRTREHLGTSDKAIIAFRRMLKDGIEKVSAGGTAPMRLDAASAAAMTGPRTYDGIDTGGDHDAYWQAGDARRRQSCPWPA